MTTGEWLTVAGGWPAIDLEVLVWQPERASIRTASHQEWTDGPHWIESQECTSLEGVTHWMLLPEPPQ